MHLYREIDVRGVLPAIDVPMLVLQRRDDRICTVGQGRYLAEAIAGAKYVELVVGSGLEFADRGAQTLKGAPGEWRLFAVSSES